MFNYALKEKGKPSHMSVSQAGSDGDDILAHPDGHFVDLTERSTTLGESPSDLVNQHSASQSTAVSSTFIGRCGCAEGSLPATHNLAL